MGISTFLAKLASDQRGTSAVEYGLILALIVLAMLSGITAFGNSTQTTWNTVNRETAKAVSSANVGP